MTCVIMIAMLSSTIVDLDQLDFRERHTSELPIMTDLTDCTRLAIWLRRK